MISSKRITIKEVAKQAGVSTQTVSRVVNNEARVASGTRSRVQAVIDQTGYRPNTVARALIRGHTNTIGIISSGIGFYGPSQTVTGIEHEAKRLGYNLTLGLLQDANRSTIANAIDEMQAQNVAGIIWAVEIDVNSEYELLRDQFRAVSVPLVAHGIQPIPNISSIRIDNYHGGCLATQHLIEQGYQRIATITGPLSQWSACERLRGWRGALKTAGLSAENDLIASGDWTPASGDNAIRQLLHRRPDIEAIFISNDQMAIGAMYVAAQLGRHVPHDLGIVGYDDLPISAYLSPSLTTIRQDVLSSGRLTMQMLHQQIKTGGNRPKITAMNNDLQPKLIVRASSQRVR